MAYRVLIVDDSPAMRNFVRRVLDLTGLEVSEYREAGDGIEALDVLKGTWIDVILTDINMPRMNGEELVRCLEQDEVLRSVPIVVISTDATETRIHRLLKLGADGYVKKPFMPETLRSELERVLGVADA
jgi:two-component system chemotaxis response regulator CheY